MKKKLTPLICGIIILAILIVLYVVGLISEAHQAISPTFFMRRGWEWITYDLPAVPALHPRWWCAPDAR